MKLLSTLTLWCLCLTVSYAQLPCLDGSTTLTAESFNMTLLASWDDESLLAIERGEVVYNDIWGYTAPSANDSEDIREYAIIGSVEKIHIFDITGTENDPNNLTEVANFTGGNQVIWRDFKTYKNYAYCVADQGNEGLIILDLSDLPNSVTKVYQENEFFDKTHNIFIENDRLYVVGQDQASLPDIMVVEPNPDVIVLDLSQTPANPTLLGETPMFNLTSLITDGYVHDIFVENNIAYCSHINDRIFAIWDFNDPDNPILMSAVPTDGLQHSSWVWENENEKYSIFAEETNNLPLGIVDVTDPTEIQIVHHFKFPLLASEGETNNIAHNPFVKGDYLYVSYYEDGIQVFDMSTFDVSDPMNPVSPTRVGWYDTFRCNTDYNGTNGNWGVYPFFDSNKIVGADTQNGLFVVMLNQDMNTALPVELAAFSGERVEKQIRLDWITHSELRGVEFSVEKQMDNSSVVQWSEIATVNAKGNAAEAVHYSANDEKPQLGNNYYRLAQRAEDGEVTYSETITVYYSNTNQPVLIYPTLLTSTDALQLVWNEAIAATVEVQIIAADGKLVQSSTIENTEKGTRKSLNINTLPKGIYTVRIKSATTEWTERVVKL